MRIHHGDHWRTFAELARKILWAATSVVVDTIHTGSSVLTHVVLAVVNVFGAVVALVSCRTLTRVVGEVIDAFRAIFARIESCSTEIDLLIAELARKSWLALARVRLNCIDASGIILATVVHAIVNVHLTTGPRVSRSALAAEATLF